MILLQILGICLLVLGMFVFVFPTMAVWATNLRLKHIGRPERGRFGWKAARITLAGLVAVVIGLGLMIFSFSPR
jgi:hypothetical protein